MVEISSLKEEHSPRVTGDIGDGGGAAGTAPPHCAVTVPHMKGLTVNAKRTLTRLALVTAIGAGSVVGLMPNAEASTTVAKLYEHQNYGGALASFSTWQNNFGCTGPTDDIDLSFQITGYMDN